MSKGDKTGMTWKGKKVTLMGLGLLGRGLGDAIFLARAGAELLVTDLKSEEELKDSLTPLKRYSNVTFVLGEHRLSDFEERDIVIHAAGVPFDSPYLAHARDKGVRVTQSPALFAELTLSFVVGVTGTRGKSAVTTLVEHLLRSAGKKTFLGGNIRGVSTLSHLPEAAEDEFSVLELDSWQLQAFGEARLSPKLSFFTSFMSDHMNYYKGDMDRYLEDKAQIFLYQKPGDTLVVAQEVWPLLEQKYGEHIKSNVLIAERESLSQALTEAVEGARHIPGEHMKKHVVTAVTGVLSLGVDEEEVIKAIQSYRLPEGRLEFLGEKEEVRWWNDTNATTPEALSAGMAAITEEAGHTQGKLVLIAGGTSKELDVSAAIEAITKYKDVVKAVVLLSGSGTEELLPHVAGVVPFVWKARSLEDAVDTAKEKASAGDHVLLSPGFSSFGLFKNEYDRGDQFRELFKKS